MALPKTADRWLLDTNILLAIIKNPTGNAATQAMAIAHATRAIGDQCGNYKCGGLAVNDGLAGTVDAMLTVMPKVLPRIKSGMLTALGVMSPQRSDVLPNIPTIVESGFTDMDLSA